jgi:hypothetical protein
MKGEWVNEGYGKWVMLIGAEDGLYTLLRITGYTHCCGWIAEHIVPILLHIICGCFRDFCEEDAKHLQMK